MPRRRPVRVDVSEAERFWAKVEVGLDCWLWLGGPNRFGYGRSATAPERWSWLTGSPTNSSSAPSRLGSRSTTCVRPQPVSGPCISSRSTNSENLRRRHARRRAREGAITMTVTEMVPQPVPQPSQRRWPRHWRACRRGTSPAARSPARSLPNGSGGRRAGDRSSVPRRRRRLVAAARGRTLARGLGPCRDPHPSLSPRHAHGTSRRRHLVCLRGA